MSDFPPTRRVLIIEDEKEIAQLIRIHLSDEGWQVVERHDGTSGLATAESDDFDLLILDLMLPGIDGLEICRKLRAQNRTIPILMLTARTTELDRVLGLELGADDYLTKPFSIRELVARVKAIWRRTTDNRQEQPQGRIRSGDLLLDLNSRTAQISDTILDLTAKEFDLLHFFTSRPGRVFTRSELLDQVWGYGHVGYEHTVNSHINRLRSKIEEDPRQPKYILTVWGVGYRFGEGGRP